MRLSGTVLVLLLIMTVGFTTGCPADEDTSSSDEVQTLDDSQSDESGNQEDLGGTGTTGDTVATEDDPCSKLDAQFVSDSLGITASDWEFDDAPDEGRTQCRFRGEKAEVITVYIDSYDTDDDAARALAASKSVAGDPAGGEGKGVSDLGGLGDSAIWVDGEMKQLFIVSGATRVSIYLSGDLTNPQAGAIELGNKVLSGVK